VGIEREQIEPLATKDTHDFRADVRAAADLDTRSR
jgi:hypothetical protein